jgi:hypothetical protein
MPDQFLARVGNQILDGIRQPIVILELIANLGHDLPSVTYATIRLTYRNVHDKPSLYFPNEENESSVTKGEFDLVAMSNPESRRFRNFLRRHHEGSLAAHIEGNR